MNTILNDINSEIEWTKDGNGVPKIDLNNDYKD